MWFLWRVEEGQYWNYLLKNREVMKWRVYEWRNHDNLIGKLGRWRKKRKEKEILMICEGILLVSLVFSYVFVLCPFWILMSLCFCVSLWKNKNNNMWIERVKNSNIWILMNLCFCVSLLLFFMRTLYCNSCWIDEWLHLHLCVSMLV